MENQDIKIKAKLWGVTGSLPAPATTEEIRAKEVPLLQQFIQEVVIDVMQDDLGQAKQFLEELSKSPDRLMDYIAQKPLSISGTYGGNTTCVEVQAKDSPLIVIDAGSGMRNLGGSLIGRLFSGKHLNPLSTDEERARQVNLLLTHYHWDHVQGFPFFGPAFLNMPDKMIDVYFHGKKNAKNSISKVLSGQMQFPNFPVVWSDLPCRKHYKELGRMESELLKMGNAEVKYQELTHPDSVLAYRIDCEGKSFVFVTDNEHRDTADPRVINLAKGADAMYIDGQYTPEEYIGKKGPNRIDWGHGTFESAVRNGLAANVGVVYIGHHEPSRNDFGIEEIGNRAIEFRDQQLKLPENDGKTLEVIMAAEGQEIVL